MIWKITYPAVITFTMVLSAHAAGMASYDFLKGRKLSQAGLSELIVNMVIMNNLGDMDKLKLIYPRSFEGLDMCRGYYDAGIWFYNSNKKMLALKAFLKGSMTFQNSSYKQNCMLYSAKIFYQMNNRESALYYVNRLLETEMTNSLLVSEAEKLKRSIRWEYIDSSEGLPDNSISAVEFDGDDLWIGMWTGGVCRFTRSSHKMTIYRGSPGGLISDNVRCIAVTDSKIWIGTYEGLCFFDKKKEVWARVRIEPDNFTVKKIGILNNSLYIATLSGLYAGNGEMNEWHKVFTNSSRISDFLFAGRTLYVATLDKGLYAIRNGMLEDILPGEPAKSLCLYEGSLWVGTHGNGVFILASGRVIRHLTTKDGLVSDYIESVKAVKNFMLLGTLGGGVMAYNFLARRWTFVNIMDGLPSNDVININFEKNRIWFGTLSGGIGILLMQNYNDI